MAACAITSGLLSGILGFLIDVWGWGMYESALFGTYTGSYAGLFVGTGWSIHLLEKGYAVRKVIKSALFMALLISGVIVVIATLIIDGLPQ